MKTLPKTLRQLLKWPLQCLLGIPGVRRRLVFELRQHHYNELECRIPLGHGLTCPVLFWEAWSSLGHIFFEEEYERAFSKMPPPGRWIDIGCYAGYFSLYVAWQRQRNGLDGRGEALLIDADSRAATAVRELLAVNQLPECWSFMSGAIAQEPGRRRFVERSFMTSSLEASANASEETVEVLVVTAPEIIRAFPPPYDLVKIDIEGGEYDFLLAYSEVLASTNFLLIEWHGWHSGGGGEAQIRAMAEERGFLFVSEVLAPTDAEHRSAERKSGVHLYRRAV